MTRRASPCPLRVGLIGLALAVHLASPAVMWASDRPADPQWIVLQERSREALSAMRTVVDHDAASDSRRVTRMVVVGFNGGREGPDSNVSGLVRLRRQIESSMAGSEHVVALTYNNRDWSRAAHDVAAYVEALEGPASLPPAAVAEPIIVVFGHSWGGGAITKFARELGTRDLAVALAVYVDAFSLRNPRVPGNVRYAVNLYQRSGILRGFPLRGKSKLVLEDPAATTVLANLQIRPQTDRYFGWHWNLVQPLFYLHHHRMGHDIRLHRYLLSLIETVDRTDALSPSEAVTCAIDDDDTCDGDPGATRTVAAAAP
jgi:hypothetical protein